MNMSVFVVTSLLLGMSTVILAYKLDESRKEFNRMATSADMTTNQLDETTKGAKECLKTSEELQRLQKSDSQCQSALVDLRMFYTQGREQLANQCYEAFEKLAHGKMKRAGANGCCHGSMKHVCSIDFLIGDGPNTEYWCDSTRTKEGLPPDTVVP